MSPIRPLFEDPATTTITAPTITEIILLQATIASGSLPPLLNARSRALQLFSPKAVATNALLAGGGPWYEKDFHIHRKPIHSALGGVRERCDVDLSLANGNRGRRYNFQYRMLQNVELSGLH